MRVFGFCLALLMAPAVALGQDTELSRKLSALMDGPDYKQASWGVLVVEAKTGRPVYARNADTLCTPASVTKLYSCAAALIALGPDSTTETPVYRRGTLTDGVLKGDLILVAAGDLTLGGRTAADGTVAFQDKDHIYANYSSEAYVTNTNPLAGLDSLAKQVVTAGVREVTGEVLIDDRLFERAAGSGSGPGTLTPILVNDNLVDVLVTPGTKPGEPAQVKLIPETAFLHADIDVTTGAKDSALSLTVRTLDDHHFTVRGSIPADGKPQLRICPVADPSAFARGLFIEALKRAGVRVRAAIAKADAVELPEKAAYEKLTKVASLQSPKLREAVKVTLKVSHNLYASTLPCLIAAKAGQTTAAAGLRLQGDVLKKLGVDVPTISFGGGAGGEWADCVTPRATVQLLDAMRGRPEWDAFQAGLPVLGVDGTLADVVGKDSPARGKVFAKTGTLTYDDRLNGRTLLRSKALAGVMTTAKGTDLTLALFVNNVPLPKGVAASREGKMLGKLCEVIYEHAP